MIPEEDMKSMHEEQDKTTAIPWNPSPFVSDPNTVL